MSEFVEIVKSNAKMYEQKLLMQEYSANTISTYTRTYRDFIDFALQYDKKLTLDNIKEMDIYAYLSYKRDKKQKDGDLSISTKTGIVTHLRLLFDFIAKNIDSDVVYDFSRIFDDLKFKKPRRKPKGLNQTEQEKIMQYVEKLISSTKYIDVRNAMIITLVYERGLRASEVLSLRYDDFQDEGDDYCIKVLGKGNKERNIFYPKPLLVTMLSRLLGEFGQASDGWIAQTKRGKVMDRTQLWRALKAIYHKAGVNSSGVHILRHTSAKNDVANGVNIVAIQHNLGHASLQTTSIYTDPTDEFVKKEYSKIRNDKEHKG